LDRIPSGILVAENAPSDRHEMPDQGMCRFREVHLRGQLFQGDPALRNYSRDGRADSRSDPGTDEKIFDRLAQTARGAVRGTGSPNKPGCTVAAGANGFQ
jgi:hypothetical protein